MMREFQIAYREQRELTLGQAQAAQVALKNNGREVVGPIYTTRIAAEVEEEARALFAEFFIIDVKDFGPVIEPGQNWFKIEQAAKYLRCSKSLLYEAIEEGKLPRPKNGDPIFSRKDLDALAALGVGKSKKKKIPFPKAA
jgi:excisionase family DNA binding protein